MLRLQRDGFFLFLFFFKTNDVHRGYIHAASLERPGWAFTTTDEDDDDDDNDDEGGGGGGDDDDDDDGDNDDDDDV